ncbi:MAG TPA: hypothetical protein VJ749_12195 [Pyrinomonadaceae bacterium]|nr:hypothetical protein [Pyrinomonadaceae bacterium]
MPEKLRLIREHLQASEPDMHAMLKLPKSCRISEYENGVSEPSLIVTLAYSRLGKVSMASVVDDDVSVKEFRGQLGTFELGITRGHAKACATWLKDSESKPQDMSGVRRSGNLDGP